MRGRTRPLSLGRGAREPVRVGSGATAAWREIPPMSLHHDFLVARADEARLEAETATLDNVRERCLRAAAAWDAMAARLRKTETYRATQLAAKAAMTPGHAQESVPAALQDGDRSYDWTHAYGSLPRRRSCRGQL